MNLLITVHAFTPPDILISFAREVSRGKIIGIEKGGQFVAGRPSREVSFRFGCAAKNALKFH